MAKHVLLFFSTWLLLFGSSSAQMDTTRTYLRGNSGRIPLIELNIGDSNSTQKKPFILFLHGAGERGDDNGAQVKVGLPVFIETLKLSGLDDYIVWAPQCPASERWTDVDWKSTKHTMKPEPTWPLQAVMMAIDSLVLSNSIDTSRMYIAGLSMGGYGTWEYIARQPYRFAAALAVCGGGDTLQALKNTSTAVWAFHGKADNVVPYQNSVQMVNATKKVNKNVHLISYSDVKHGSWNRAFAEKKIIREFIFCKKQ